VASAFLTGSHLAGELMETEIQSKYHRLGKLLSAKLIEQFFPENGPLYRSQLSGHMDGTIDVSLLGLIRPFGIFGRKSPATMRILEAVRSKLWCRSVGGVLRYEGDTYRGGNPWILATLWLAYSELIFGNISEAREAFQWVVAKATPLGMLAEQVHKDSGNPFWVIPLGWSHAMFLLFVREVIDQKLDSKIWNSI
jgi:GH15 family glucan-1,4-alpha-glucosidase